MTKVYQERILPFAPQKLYVLVNDVEKYPEFIPWCLAARVRKKSENYQLADLVVGFNVVKETFTSHVHSNPDELVVTSELVRGPFKHLSNVWAFCSDPGGNPDACLVTLKVDFEFSNPVLGKMIEAVFEDAQKRMIAAFEKRAYTLYGLDGSRGKNAKNSLAAV